MAMRLRRLLSASVLLWRAAGPSVAFQVPAGGGRLAAAVRGASPLLREWAGPLSKRGGLLRLPWPRKKSRSGSAGGEGGDEKFDKEILALVTTCCLTFLLRPATARAAAGASLVDLSTLTYGEAPGLGILPCGLPRWDPSFDDKAIRGSLALLAQTLAAVGALAAGLVLFACANLVALALVRSLFDWWGGITSACRWSALFVKCHALSGSGSSDGVQVQGRRSEATGEVEVTAAEDGTKLRDVARTFQENKQKVHRHGSDPKPSALDRESAGGSDLPDRERSTRRDYELRPGDPRAGGDGAGNRARMMEIMRNLITWDDYMRLVDELQDSKRRVEDLNGEVARLRCVLRIERAVRQATSARVPDGRVPQEEQSLHRAALDRMLDFGDGKYDESDELRELGEKSRMYEESIDEALEGAEGVDWHEEQDLGSGIR